MQDYLRGVFKLTIFCLLLISYISISIPLLPMLTLFPNKTRKLCNYLLQAYSKALLLLIGIKVKTNIQSFKIGGELIVCNHLGYLDILVIASRFPTSFVTSLKMKRTAVLGQLCSLAGCVFVNRKNKDNIGHEIQEITEALSAGINVAVFPEATSTNGESVLRFRRPLFQAAIDSQTLCRPMTLNYLKLSGKKVCIQNRDKIFWYGDMTFFDHLWGVFQESSIEVYLDISEQIPVHSRTKSADLAMLTQEIVTKKFEPIFS